MQPKDPEFIILALKNITGKASPEQEAQLHSVLKKNRSQAGVYQFGKNRSAGQGAMG